MEQLRQLGLYWAISYGALAGTFLVLGVAVTFFNKRLGEHMRIQKRKPPEKQVRRDFWQSLKSLVTIALFLAIGLYFRKIGLGIPALEPTVLNTTLTVIASMILFDTWFYWGHRLIHLKPIYKYVHLWHHKAVTPTVWSNNSDTFLDNCIVQAYWIIVPFILPIPFWGIVIHKLYDQVTGMLGHSGFEYSPGPLSSFPSPLVGVTFHDQHHERFDVNYATHFSFWDRLMGTLDPEYDKAVLGFKAKPKKV